jgi:hypothetical protein
MSAPITLRLDLSVYDGRDCVGFIRDRGERGVEAFDRNERSVGIYPTQRAAVRALGEVRHESA